MRPKGSLGYLCLGVLVFVPGSRLLAEAAPEARLRTSLAAMHAWVGQGDRGDGWRAYLLSQELMDELQRGPDADPVVVARVLGRYQSGAAGLERRPFAILRTHLRSWHEQLQQDENLPQLARQTSEEVTAVTPAQLDSARRALRASYLALDRQLSRGGDRGRAWKEYLQWDILEQQTRPAQGGDLGSLAAVYNRLRANHLGLERRRFRELRLALRRYMDLVNVARLEDQQERLGSELERLADDLEQYMQQPQEPLAFEIGRRVGFFDGLGQSPRLVRAIRRRLSRPNLRARVSESLVARAAQQTVDDTRGVTDYILGTSISGTAHTVGAIDVRTVPSEASAKLVLQFTGTAESNTVGVNGPVCVYATGCTQFCATKAVYFSDDGLWSQPAAAQANTQTQLHDIQARSRLIQKIAWKRAYRQKPRAEAIASEHAESRLERQFDDEASEQIRVAQEWYWNRFRRPLERLDEFPQYLAANTTGQALHLELLQANRSQLGASTAPPEFAEEHALSLSVHESMPNNYAAALLGGFTLSDAWLKEQILEAGRELPPELADPEAEPWSITFARQRPVTVVFDEGGFTVTIRGSRFTSGDRPYGSMNITAVYQIDTHDEGAVLRRQGDLEILPPNFDPQTDRLSAQDTALRNILIKRLADLFKEEVQGEGLELPGEWQRVGRLPLADIASQRGWLSIAWDLSAPSPPPPVAQHSEPVVVGQLASSPK